MPTVLITPEAMRHKSAPYVDVLREAGFEILYPRDAHFARGLAAEQATIDELSVADATIASNERYSEVELSQLPRLRVIARAGVGYDRVDVEAASRHGVAVTITPTANHDAVAELALALLLAACKSLVANDRRVRGGHWPRELLVPVRGKTLGLLGLGRIGRSTAVRAQALGMHVIAAESQPDRAFIARAAIELVGFEELLARSDFLSIHCPLTPSTRGLFDRDVLRRMKPGSILVNTARGPIVVESDLAEALRDGPLRAAALDVLAQEPPAPDNPLLALENVVLSPHLAGTDELSLEQMGVEAAQCIAALYRGQWPEGAVVNTQLRDSWRW